MSTRNFVFSAIRAESQKLRVTVGNVSNQAVTEIKQHWVATNTVSKFFKADFLHSQSKIYSLIQAFHERIKETEETQRKLQSHLNKTLQEIRDQEKHIEQLRAAVKAKGQPLKTAQARLALRSKLPTEEACLDLAQVLLLEVSSYPNFISTYFLFVVLIKLITLGGRADRGEHRDPLRHLVPGPGRPQRPLGSQAVTGARHLYQDQQSRHR